MSGQLSNAKMHIKGFFTPFYCQKGVPNAINSCCGTYKRASVTKLDRMQLMNVIRKTCAFPTVSVSVSAVKKNHSKVSID